MRRISLVTPSFNQAEFLEETIESVIVQDYPELEWIVIDGGSTDGSVEILKRYEAYFSYWVSEPDEGQTQALIKGFSKAAGDIFCWLNSDDLHEPWTLREVDAAFEGSSDLRFIYGDSTWIDQHGGVLRPKKEHGFIPFVWMYDHNFIPQPSSFWRGDLYEEVGGLDNQFSLAMDADLWARFAEKTRPEHISRPWSRMRQYPEQKNMRLRGLSNAEDLLIRERYVGRQAPWQRAVKKAMAKAVRVSNKLARGCYW